MFRRLWNDEVGVVVSAELVLILTIAVIGLVVGLSEVAVGVNTELNDLSNAFGAISQSFYYGGVSSGYWFGARCKGFMAGSIFIDGIDDCDINLSCDMVCGAPGWRNGG